MGNLFVEFKLKINKLNNMKRIEFKNDFIARLREAVKKYKETHNL